MYSHGKDCFFLGVKMLSWAPRRVARHRQMLSLLMLSVDGLFCPLRMSGCRNVFPSSQHAGVLELGQRGGTMHCPHGSREAKSLFHHLGCVGCRLLSKELASLSSHPPIQEASSEVASDHGSFFGIPNPSASPLVCLVLSMPSRAGEPCPAGQP